MKKILCTLLVVVLLAGIIPFAALAEANQDAIINIGIDIEGNITMEPHIADRGVIFDGDFIHIRLPMEIDAENVRLVLPEAWTYEINHETENPLEPLLGHGAAPEPKTYTVVTVNHTWLSAEEDAPVGFVPFVSSAPLGFQRVDLRADASPQEWSNAIGSHTNGNNRVINVMGDQPNFPGNYTIQGAREVIIASQNTNLTTYTRDGTPFVITHRSGTGRHFTVSGGATLSLAQITLDGRTPTGTTHRGGVYVLGFPAFLNMWNGAEICNSRADQGGGVMAETGATVLIDGGILRNNVATTNFYGGGGGVKVNWRSSLTLRNALIEGNEAVAEYGHGGGVDVVYESVLAIEAGTVIRGNTAGLRGGGICIWYNAQGVMDDGQIIGNDASQAGGGIVVTGANLNVLPDATSFIMNGGTIEGNTAGERGGGISGFDIDDIPDFPRIANQTITINGGKIFNNTAGNGGGLWFSSGTVLTAGGEIHNNTATKRGGGVYWSGGNWTGGANTVAIYANSADGNGGGVAAVEMDSNTVAITTDNRTLPTNVRIEGNTAANGGGMTVEMARTGNRSLTIPGSIIRNNYAVADGGGLYIPHENLSILTINEAVEFSGNVAGNGLNVDSPLAAAHHPRINPGTVSTAELGELLVGLEFVRVFHAFTNYDINTTAGTQFWRVTYDVGDGAGSVAAKIETGNVPILSGTFVPHNTTIIFDAEPAQLFDRWEIGRRLSEIDEGGDEVAFTYTDGGTTTPLSYLVTAHTHAVGHFLQRLPTTTLTISKEVTGLLGNRLLEFEFTILFQAPGDVPLPPGTQFHYAGGTLDGTGATAPPDGILILDSNGRATFHLSHGQVIHIEGIPLGGRIQLIETPNANYTAFFADSEHAGDPIIGNDTTMLPITADRVFAFTNDRDMAPPTGVNAGKIGAALLLPAILLLLAVAGLATNVVWHRRKQGM